MALTTVVFPAIESLRCCSLQKPQEFDGEGKYLGGVLLSGDLHDGLQKPQLQRGRMFGHSLGGLGKLLRRLQFAVGGDDPGASFTLGLGLAQHRALHRIRQYHILDFDTVDLHTPAQRGAVDHQFQALIEMLSVGQQVVQVAFADY